MNLVLENYLLFLFFINLMNRNNNNNNIYITDKIYLKFLSVIEGERKLNKTVLNKIISIIF